MSTIPEQGVINLGPDQPLRFGMGGTRSELEGVFARSIRAARQEWEKECREAYELGLFDIGVDQWIAQRLVQDLTKWQDPKVHVQQHQLNVAIDALDDYARLFGDSYGLPLYPDTKAEMRRILNDKLGLGIEL